MINVHFSVQQFCYKSGEECFDLSNVCKCDVSVDWNMFLDSIIFTVVLNIGNICPNSRYSGAVAFSPGIPDKHPSEYVFITATDVVAAVVAINRWLNADCSNSIANALELLQSCTKPLKSIRNILSGILQAPYIIQRVSGVTAVKQTRFQKFRRVGNPLVSLCYSVSCFMPICFQPKARHPIAIFHYCFLISK